MYGESAAMRRRAGQLREQGADVRALADRLVAQVDAVGWTGRAATALRDRVQDRAALLRNCATQHENAAESLERHLTEVDLVKDAIADVERRAGSLVDEYALLRERFVAPPPGHKDWLNITLPGL